MTDAAGPRITLLDGFSIHFGGVAQRHIAEDLPRCVQRLVANLDAIRMVLGIQGVAAGAAALIAWIP